MIVKAKDISRQFLRDSKNTNIFTAVEKTDIEFKGGNMIVLTGRSGSGKSTLLNMLSGLLTPTTGTVLYDDKDIYSYDDKTRSVFRNNNIGVIPQGQTGLSSLSVIENIMLPCMMYEDEGSNIDYAKELLERMDIAHLKNAYPNELSGGEMRRLAIARALIKKPEVVFADEPTGDLDDENTKDVLELLRQTADEGAAVFLVSHDKEACDYSDVIYKMDKGTLLENR